MKLWVPRLLPGGADGEGAGWMTHTVTHVHTLPSPVPYSKAEDYSQPSVASSFGILSNAVTQTTHCAGSGRHLHNKDLLLKRIKENLETRACTLWTKHEIPTQEAQQSVRARPYGVGEVGSHEGLGVRTHAELEARASQGDIWDE